MKSVEALPEMEPEKEKSTTIVDNEGEVRRPPVLILLLYWSVMSLIAFSFAGERMPWLTTHITMPMILASGWSFGKLLESFDWSTFKKNRGWITAHCRCAVPDNSSPNLRFTVQR